MSDILTVKRQLQAKAQTVAAMLFPNGQKEGPEWRVGSLGGEAGKSLGVHLTGEKAGIWSDFSTGEGGDLLDLWCAVKRITLPEALEEARAYLGLERPRPTKEPRRDFRRPAKPKCTTVAGRVLDYLTEDRNIPDEVLRQYKVAARDSSIVFPFLLPDGELALVKTREAKDGAKPKPTEADCEPVLFGWQAIPENAREVVITEGEIDALSFAAYGYAALSVPFGGGKGAKQQWIEGEFDRMERFERICIATDMDTAGDEAAQEISSRLGRHRCVRVKLPRKDANDCLVDGVPQEEIAAAVRTAAHMDPEGLRRAIDYTDAVKRLFWPANDEPEGFTVPYEKLRRKLYFRPGEVTLWTGATGAGKSQVLSDCAVDWIRLVRRVCVASFEMKGEQTLKRMNKQTGNIDRPSPEYIDAIMEYLDQGLLLFDRVGKAGVSKVTEVFDYARAKYGCDQFVIDSFMRLGIGNDDYKAQEAAMFDLVNWAVGSDVHLHLVAHARKGDKERGAPDAEDVKGASEIASNAHNVISIWRNRKLEDEINAAKSDDEKDELRKKPGVIMNVAKQRNGDYEGKIGLWFDTESYRYRSAQDTGMFNRQYVKLEKEAAE